jgi:cobalt-zinc-cadmium efflux system membrane fusion protein
MRFMKFDSLAPILWAVLFFGGCGFGERPDPRAEAPLPTSVEHEQDANIVQVSQPEQFPLATAVRYVARGQIVTTGVVSPEVSRTVPIVSLASGRAVELRARLGDSVEKGQLLVRIQSSEVSSAFADYQKAVADEALAHTQLDRAKLLYAKGAISQNEAQIAEDADNKASVDLATSAAHLRLLGGDPNHPMETVDVVAPVSGVIVEQNIAPSSGVKSLDNSPNLFTIADLSSVWILCDVYENDLASVRTGETAEIRLNAYPDKVFSGHISNISPVLDPALHTAKVRIEVRNPGLMRVGMFVSATFHSLTEEVHCSIPASAILHLHDRDWVFVPGKDKQFRRVEIVSGQKLPDNMQEIVSGIEPGQQVVVNALALESSAGQ